MRHCSHDRLCGWLQDLYNSNENCGWCGTKCDVANNQACIYGQCKQPKCDEDYIYGGAGKFKYVVDVGGAPGDTFYIMFGVGDGSGPTHFVVEASGAQVLNQFVQPFVEMFDALLTRPQASSLIEVKVAGDSYWSVTVGCARPPYVPNQPAAFAAAAAAARKRLPKPRGMPLPKKPLAQPKLPPK